MVTNPAGFANGGYPSETLVAFQGYAAPGSSTEQLRCIVVTSERTARSFDALRFENRPNQ